MMDTWQKEQQGLRKIVLLDHAKPRSVWRKRMLGRTRSNFLKEICKTIPTKQQYSEEAVPGAQRLFLGN
jgi:hypothetical protein